MRGFWKQQLWVVLAAAFVVSLNLGAARLWDEDEPKNATCAAEMLARGDWTVPTFNGELRTDKPILLYWCMLLSYHVFGVTELGARITSALCGVGTALLTYHLGRRLFGAATGLWAGLLLCSSLMFVVAARGATPDSLLIFFSTLAIWFFVNGSTAADKRVPGSTPQLPSETGHAIIGLPSHWRTYVLMYEAMAFAVLAKGPVGFLLPSAVIGLYLLVINPAPAAAAIPTAQSNSRFRQIRSMLAASVGWLWRTMSPSRIVRMAWAMRPLTGLAMLAVVALPWYLLVGMETHGAWPVGFFWHHNVDRYVASLDGHQGVPLYHFFSIAAGFFPASVFLLPMVVNTVRRLKADDPARRGYVLAACWIAVYLVVFSFCRTKLPSYVTPTYPALALLTAALLQSWISRPSVAHRFWQGLPMVVLGVVGMAVIGVTVTLAGGFLNKAPAVATKQLWSTQMTQCFAGQWSLVLLGAMPLAIAAGCGVLFYRGRPRRAVQAFVGGSAIFTATLFGWGLLKFDQFQESAAIGRLIQQPDGRWPQLASYHVIRPSWVFYAQQPVDQLADPHETVQRLKQEQPSYLILEEPRLKELQPLLPPDVQVVGRVPRFLKSGSLVVLGRVPAPRSAAVQTANSRDYSRR